MKEIGLLKKINKNNNIDESYVFSATFMVDSRSTEHSF